MSIEVSFESGSAHACLAKARLGVISELWIGLSSCMSR